MAVNECFFDSATLRENVVSLARNIGYVPRSSRAANVVDFTVDLGTNDTKIVTLKGWTSCIRCSRWEETTFFLFQMTL